MRLRADLTLTKRSEHALKSSDAKIRHVSQGDLLYYRRDQEAFGANGPFGNLDELLGYDGQTTRILEQGLVANVVEGRKENVFMPRPHTMALHNSLVKTALSEFLAAKEYAHGITHTLKVLGEERCDGFRCVKLRDDYGKPSPTGYRLIWLAVDRNYIPIRCDSYRTMWSEKVPRASGHVTELREIAPGVWFPWHMVYTLHVPEKVRQGQIVVHETTEYTTDKAELSPRYEISLFRNIPFPDGVRVYEVRNGEIVNKYWTEAPVKPADNIKSQQ